MSRKESARYRWFAVAAVVALVLALALPAPVVVEISAEAAAAEPDGERLLREAGPALRLDLWRRLGVPLAEVLVRAAPLPPGAWAVLVEGAPAAAGRIPAGRALCLAPPEELRLAGIPSLPRAHPLGGTGAGAIPSSLASRAGGFAPVLGPVAWSLAEAAAALHRSAHQLVGVQEVQVLLDALEPEAPALVREAARLLPPALVAEVLRRLLEEGVAVRPLRSILQALLADGPSAGPAALAERCRRYLSRHILERVTPGETDRPLQALLLDPLAEAAMRDALLGETAAISPAEARALIESVQAGLSGSPRPRALLAPGDVRRALRNLLAGAFPELPVLSYEELPPGRRVAPVGRATISS